MALFKLIYVDKKHARKLVRTHLDDALCFKDQKPDKLDSVWMEVNRFMYFDNFI
jgi:hypothetical protein